MTLKLHYHPLSSYCWKVLIALYENQTPFEGVIIDFGDEASRAAFFKLWLMGKMPVLEDAGRDWMVPETSIIIEYLAQHHPGRASFLPTDPDQARQVRMRDRFYDLYVHTPMQKVVGDRLRPADAKDPFGVDEARAMLAKAYDMVEADRGSK